MHSEDVGKEWIAFLLQLSTKIVSLRTDKVAVCVNLFMFSVVTFCFSMLQAISDFQYDLPA